MALLRPEIFLKTLVCAWRAKRGDVLKKHPQARLRVSFLQQIQHSRSESSPVFSVFLIRLYLGNPWFKIFSREEA
jgi:hypothetical protein